MSASVRTSEIGCCGSARATISPHRRQEHGRVAATSGWPGPWARRRSARRRAPAGREVDLRLALALERRARARRPPRRPPCARRTRAGSAGRARSLPGQCCRAKDSLTTATNGASRVSAVADVAAGPQRDAERREKAGRHEAQAGAAAPLRALRPAPGSWTAPDAAAHHHGQEAGVRGPLHAGQRAHAGEHVRVEAVARRRRLVPRQRQRRPQGQHALARGSPGSTACTRHRARISSPRRDQQHDRQRSPPPSPARQRSRSRRPPTPPRAPSRRPAASDAAQRAPGGRHAEAQRDGERGQRPRRPGPAGRRPACPRWAATSAPAARRAGVAAKASSTPSAPPMSGQQQALGQQLAQQALAARAQRGAHRQLLPPHQGPRQQQARQVRARDQQHAEGRAEQRRQQQARPGAPPRRGDGPRLAPMRAFACGWARSSCAATTLHLRARLLEGDARLQAADRRTGSVSVRSS